MPTMVRSASLSLFSEEFTQQRPELPAAFPPLRRTIPKRLWMAVHFPRLPFETKRVPLNTSDPIGVIGRRGSRAVIVDCTEGAIRAGVQPGLALNAALVLAPKLRVVERDEVLEKTTLMRLAEIGYRFTPTVSVEAPESLLLEVAGSAHLFGGPDAIRARARDTFRVAGFSSKVALAPTPLAALWLSRAAQETSVTRQEELRSVLGKLPVCSVFWELTHQDAFARLGIEYLVDLFRLPRKGLARRFGLEFLETLDRAIGDQPDPRAAWVMPKRVKLNREMPGELIQMAHLSPYIEDMVAELTEELRRHDAGIDRIKFLFKHFQQRPTMLVVSSILPHREESRWNALIQNKLANQTLPAPVLDIDLLSGQFMRHTAQSPDLLGRSHTSSESLSRLVDTLRSRLDRTAVYGMAVTPDARPEHAWRSTEPGEAVGDSGVHSPRPIQVLQQPLVLNCANHRPCYNGAALTIVEGPERIEGGWWSDETWTRDYYEAMSARGERLWIYRQQKQWFLHGMFS